METVCKVIGLHCIKMDINFTKAGRREWDITVARYRGQRRNVVQVSTESCIPLPNRTKDTRGREMRHIIF